MNNEINMVTRSTKAHFVLGTSSTCLDVKHDGRSRQILKVGQRAYIKDVIRMLQWLTVR